MRRFLGWLIHRLELPPGWMIGLAAIAWGQAQLVPFTVLGRLGDVVGGALVLAGMSVSGWAALHFMLERTSLIPRTRPNRLVTTGMYRFSRNPIYLADTAILLGLILYWDALLCLPFVPLYMKVIELRFIRREEAVLRDHFGAAFDAYAARVRRWL